MERVKTKLVVVSAKCSRCKGKVFGMAETRDQALKRLEFNLNQHQARCTDSK